MPRINLFNNKGIIVESVVDILSEELSEADKIAFSNLKTACENLIEGINKIIIEANRTEDIINKENLSSGMTALYLYMRKSSDFTRKILNLQHTFQKALDTFLDRTIYLTWVNSKGEIFYYNQADIERIYNMATTNVGRGNISQSKMKKYNIQNSTKNISNTNISTTNIENLNNSTIVNEMIFKMKRKIKLSQNMRKRVYLEAVNRFQKSKNKKDSEIHNSVYWRENILFPNLITGYKQVRNRGDIAEGYVDSVINEDKNVVYTGVESPLVLEVSLRHLSNHININNISAIIKGDIVYNENGNIQFAVKQGSYSTARFGQYLQLAFNTLALNTMSKNQYLKILPLLLNPQVVENEVDDIANEQVKNVVDSTLSIKSK